MDEQQIQWVDQEVIGELVGAVTASEPQGQPEEAAWYNDGRFD